MYWDRFDICEAWYMYCTHYHSGQWSYLYRKLSQLIYLKFKPSPLLCFDSLSENGKEIYASLVEREFEQ